MFHTGASLASTGEPCFTKRLCPCSKVVDISTQLHFAFGFLFSFFFLFFWILIHAETLLQVSWSRSRTYLHLHYLYFFFLSFFLLPKETLPFLQRSWTPNPTYLHLDFLSGKYTNLKYTRGDFPNCNLHQPITLSPVLLSQVPRIGQLAKNYLSHKPTFHLNNFERIVQLAVCITFHNPALGVVRILGLRKERKTLFCIFDFFPTLQERFSAWCCWWSGLEKKEKKIKDYNAGETRHLALLVASGWEKRALLTMLLWTVAFAGSLKVTYNSSKHSGLFILTGIGPLGVLRKPSEGLAMRKPSAVSGERRSSGILSNHPAHQEVREVSAKNVKYFYDNVTGEPFEGHI